MTAYLNLNTGRGLLAKLGILFFAFFLMLIVVGVVKAITDAALPGNPRNAFLITSTLQSLLVFILPACIVARICSPEPTAYLQIPDPKREIFWLIAPAMLLIFMPAANWIVAWNESLVFPQSLNGIEALLRSWEESAAETTGMILGDPSAWGLISGIIVIGMLTGFAEEMFFRAGVQRAMTTSGWNAHAAIWLAAFLFSTFHFQFFGFFPRLLLGAMFGYLYYWSGSIWPAALAHALNNSLVVITAWLASNGLDTQTIEQAGTENPWLALISFCATLGLGIIINRKLSDTRK